MSLGLDDLIASILRNPSYVEQVYQEIHPDDTMALLQGARKGKSEFKEMYHILGPSEVNVRIKAKELRTRAVTQIKMQQLTSCINALGIYLRKFIVENVNTQEDVTLDT